MKQHSTTLEYLCALFNPNQPIRRRKWPLCHFRTATPVALCQEITDEVMPWEENCQCNLMNAIFSQVVKHQVQVLQKKKCCGCKIDHPSQQRHDCIMLTKEEGWITYGLEAIGHVPEQEILWKQFREAIRIMQFIPHDHTLQHFKKLSSNQEATLELLMDLINVQGRPLQISRHSVQPPLLAKRTLNIFT